MAEHEYLGHGVDRLVYRTAFQNGAMPTNRVKCEVRRAESRPHREDFSSTGWAQPSQARLAAVDVLVNHILVRRALAALHEPDSAVAVSAFKQNKLIRVDSIRFAGPKAKHMRIPYLEKPCARASPMRFRIVNADSVHGRGVVREDVGLAQAGGGGPRAEERGALVEVLPRGRARGRGEHEPRQHEAHAGVGAARAGLEEEGLVQRADEVLRGRPGQTAGQTVREMQ